MKFKKIYHKYTDRHWNIGFLENSIDDIVGGKSLRPVWMKHSYKDRWFADPFVLDVDENYIYILAEEYYMPIHRAYIAKLTIEKDTKQLVDTKPILKLETHLSYPAIIRKEGKVFFYPESGKSGKLVLYEYDPITDKVAECQTILNEDVGDATYTTLFGEELLFCTKPPLYNDEVLHIYKKKNGVYIDSEIVTFGDKVARMAGDFFQVNGKIYRPAQDCNKSYGNGLVIQEVTFKDGKWAFNEIHRYYSPNPDYPLGIHTFNMFKDVMVVDSVGYWHPYLAKLLTGLKHIITGLKHIVK